jgi:hypothetical protein
MVPLMNYSNEVYTVAQNERVAQLVAINTGSIAFEKVEELDISERSHGWIRFNRKKLILLIKSIINIKVTRK